MNTTYYQCIEKVLTAISKTVEFTKWLGEELASQVYGVAGDDIIRLKKNLDDAKAKLKELEDGYKAVAFADKLLGKVGISTDFLDKIRGIKSAREEVSRLQKQIDDYNESQAKRKPAAPKVPTAPNVPVMATNKTEGGGHKAAAGFQLSAEDMMEFLKTRKML